MNGAKEIVNSIYKKIKKIIDENPLFFSDEKEVVAYFYQKLKSHPRYKGKVLVICKTIEERIKKRKFKTPRVHLEFTTENISKDKSLGLRCKVDIIVVRGDKEIELLGYNYRKGTPSTILKDEVVESALEIKYLRGVKVKIKKFRKGEIQGFENDIRKLDRIKKNNKRAFVALIIFTHPKMEVPAFEDVFDYLKNKYSNRYNKGRISLLYSSQAVKSNIKSI